MNATTVVVRAVALQAAGHVLPAAIGIAGRVVMIVAADVRPGQADALLSPVASEDRADGGMMIAASESSARPSRRHRVCRW